MFEFAGSTNENAKKVTADQSEAMKQQIRTPLTQNVPKMVDNHQEQLYLGLGY